MQQLKNTWQRPFSNSTFCRGFLHLHLCLFYSKHIQYFHHSC